MRIPRTSIAGMMGGVAVISLALTALRSGSALWAGATFLVTCGVLGLAIVGAACRRGSERAWWLGFALFGWGYLTLVFWAPDSAVRWNVPTNFLLYALRPRPAVGLANDDFLWLSGAFAQAAHCLFGLLAATLGGLIARGLFGAPAGQPESDAEARSDDRPPRRGWRQALVIGSIGFVATLAVAMAGLRWAQGATAGLAFTATWGLLALAVVRAAFGPRSCRASWLGAALFGVGYMSAIFYRPAEPNWLHVGTDRLLESLRERFPWIVRETPNLGDIAALNARILKVLNRPIPLHFPKQTPLEDAIKAIQEATKGPDGHVIAIYVDPLGLQEVEKTMQSPISINLEGAPLRTSLTLALRQLGLTYAVVGGVLSITSAESDEWWGDIIPAHVDPFLVVGHCLFALIAVGLGAFLAPLVCQKRE
jgi:hypothetical protein